MAQHGRVIILGGAISAVTIAAYSNSFQGDFLFDDIHAIVENPHIRKLRPLAFAMSAPAQSSLAGRPLVSLSFAINHAISGMNEAGFHAGNLLIHLCAALALFGFLREALRRVAASGPCSGESGGANRIIALPMGASALASIDGLAALCAVLWAVHPLQTESVTYIVQRAESLMGLLLLLTLYLSARSFEAARPLAWRVGAIVCCALGMGCKESMVIAPILVLLYDGLIVSGSIVAALRRRWLFYTALFSTWLILAALVAGGPRSQTVGFEMRDLTPWSYLRSQCGVIVHYLRLSCWPHPLCLDYDWPVARSLGEVWISALVLVALLGLTVWGLVRRSAWAFLGAWFFITLAPSSSVVPIADLAFEHRMYLALAAVIVAGVLLTGRLASRWIGPRAWRPIGVSLAVLVLAAEVYGTIRRNRDYADGLAMWRQVVELRPRNTRARVSMGIILAARGDFDGALQACRDSLRIDPRDADAAYNIAKALQQAGAIEQAMGLYQEAIRIDPRNFRSKTNLGEMLSRLGRHAEAVEQYQSALADQPGELLPLRNMGMALLAAERYAEAAQALGNVVQTDANDLDARCDLATALLRLGRPRESEAQLREVLGRNARHVAALYALGTALEALDRADEAAAAYRAAIDVDPRHADARCNLGGVLSRQGRMVEAMSEYRAVLAARPDHLAARYNLGAAWAAQGNMAEAVREFEEVLRRAPDHEPARSALARARRASTSSPSRP